MLPVSTALGHLAHTSHPHCARSQTGAHRNVRPLRRMTETIGNETAKQLHAWLVEQGGEVDAKRLQPFYQIIGENKAAIQNAKKAGHKDGVQAFCARHGDILRCRGKGPDLHIGALRRVAHGLKAWLVEQGGEGDAVRLTPFYDSVPGAREEVQQAKKQGQVRGIRAFCALHSDLLAYRWVNGAVFIRIAEYTSGDAVADLAAQVSVLDLEGRPPSHLAALESLLEELKVCDEPQLSPSPRSSRPQSHSRTRPLAESHIPTLLTRGVAGVTRTHLAEAVCR